MLDCSVDVKQPSNLRPAFNTAPVRATVSGKLQSPVQGQVSSITTQDGVTLSSPPSPTPSEILTQATPPREFVGSGVRFTHEAPTSAYANRTDGQLCAPCGPLPLGIQPVPVYFEELKAIEGRYPGVAAKLCKLESVALTRGYTPDRSQVVEKEVLSSPPWPQTDYGDPRVNISAKAAELHQIDPSLKTSSPEAYDFKKANREAAGLMETLGEMFPKDSFPGIVMGARAKTPQSLAKKMEKLTGFDPNFTLAHLTDTVGARIDSPDLKTLGVVAKGLEEKYKDNIVAKSDYVSTPGANGYRAIHYTVDINGRMVEIQASTTSLRAADLATHDTVYKPEFPVSPETAQELATAADRIMYVECLKLKESG